MLAELLDAVAVWPALLIAVIVFGFAPGAVLRLIVLAFPKDDPRRAELLAEVYVVPRWERPFWVAEQLEVALFEGIWGRIVWAATGRIIDRWSLGSGVERNHAHPDSFWIPDDARKDEIVPGVLVKLMFEMKDGWGERMWVVVEAVNGRKMVGSLHNNPIGIPRLCYGDRITFDRDCIIDIDWPSEELPDPLAIEA